MKPAFNRKLSENNYAILAALSDAVEPNWFKDALADPKIFFALRVEQVDAYYLGSRIYSIRFPGGEAVPETHVKFLVRPRAKSYIKMRNSVFAYSAAEQMQSSYVGGETLNQIKAASKRYAGVEACGVYRTLERDSMVVDVELSMTRATKDADATASESDTIVENVDLQATRRLDRIDVVRLEAAEQGYKLVFWEAKHFQNSELFGDSIKRQLADYKKQIERHENALVDVYRRVCKFQGQILRMRFRQNPEEFPRASDDADELDLIAQPGTPLGVDTEPRLFVFGFDNSQRKDSRWTDRKSHLEGLLGKHRVRCLGKPTPGGFAVKK